MYKCSNSRGFTLIEMAIVLVVIGLIIGGTLVGQEMINNAVLRAQITQLEKFNSAVHTFQAKFGYLPGDIPDPYATQFGFVPRGPNPGQGDGNGIIQSPHNCFAYTTVGYGVSEGEQSVFWEDLSMAGMISGGFNVASETAGYGFSGAALGQLYPSAMLGNGNYVNVLSDGVGYCTVAHDGNNYFAVSVVTNVNSTAITTQPGMTVAQANAIDTKIDDGLPQSGRVQAQYDSFAANGVNWVAGGGSGAIGASPGTPAFPASTSCYDNAGNASAAMRYSMTQNNGANLNCALTFRFQ